MKNYIVIVSDCSDVAYNEMRAAIANELDALGSADDVVVEPVVSAAPFSIINGAFLVRLMAEIYPPARTTMLVVLNPSKVRPERIAGETKNGFKFVGANTGTLNWLINDFGLKKLYELRDPGFVSFGGKYVHSPAAAKVATGIEFEKVGNPIDPNVISKFKIEDGTAVHIDNFGLVKIKGKPPSFNEGQKLSIYVNNTMRFEAVYANRMMNLDDGVTALYRGSSLGGMPEIGMVRKTDGAKLLGIKIGDMVRWETSSR
ncbi:MAG: SAM-dependent chlorinase/fluorinase [Candidatus Marsarchaeota archaeon]|nr:SAM-dependent chlorinase/fluorinase [Candidatus Marsarchaeota archaeon]